jgi:hypothetical protein
MTAAGLRYKSALVWRNWQTRRTQNPVAFGPCGFDSLHQHHLFGKGLLSGHLTRSMFARYNIGRERDAAAAPDTMAEFHHQQQERLATQHAKVRPIRRPA